MATHSLKTWPQAFTEIINGTKKFEYRENDRNFENNDVLLLKEFIPCERCGGSRKVWDNGDLMGCPDCFDHSREKSMGGKYTGNECGVMVTSILYGPMHGVRERYCVMSIVLGSTKLNSADYKKFQPASQPR